MTLRILAYSDERREKDFESFLKTGVYRPSYADAVKEFLERDIGNLCAAFPRRTYFFMHFSDDFERSFKGNMPQSSVLDEQKLARIASFDARDARADETESRRYKVLLKGLYQAGKNGVEGMFLNNGRTMLAAVCRFLRSPLYSVWLAAGTQCRALYSRFGASDVSEIVLEGIFAASYIYLRGAETGDSDRIAEWCADNSAAESLSVADDPYFFEYPAVKKALEILKKCGAAGFYTQNGLDFGALYDFSVSVAEAVGGNPVREDVSEAEKRVEKTAGKRRTIVEDMCAELVNGAREGAVFKRYAERAPSLARQIKQWRDLTQVRDFVRVKLHDRAREAMYKTRGERQRGG